MYAPSVCGTASSRTATAPASSSASAVRSVRNYLVSLPDDSSVPQNRPHFRPNTLSSAPLPKRQVSQPNSPHDPLTRIRGRALEVLTVLRELEERARLPLDHDAYDAQSDHGSSSNDTNVGPASRGASPSSHLDESEFVDGDTSVSVSGSWVNCAASPDAEACAATIGRGGRDLALLDERGMGSLRGGREAQEIWRPWLGSEKLMRRDAAVRLEARTGEDAVITDMMSPAAEMP